MLIPTTVLTQTTAFVGVRAVRSTSQSIGPSAFTSVQYNAADTYDTNSFHDPASSNTRITIPEGKAGYYTLAAEAAFELSTAGTRGGLLLLNGTTAIGTTLTPPGPGFGTTLHVIGTYNLVVGDFVEVQVFQSTVVNLSLDSSWFTAQWLGT